MGESWLTRLLIIVLFVGLAKAAPLIGWIIVAVGGTFAVLWLVREAGLLPRFVMDVLNRLSNKAALEQALQKRKQTLELIDANELAEFLKSRIIGQDAVCDEVAAHLRRRLAARRPDKPLAVFCFAGPPGVGKTYFAKVLAEKLYGSEKYLLFFDMSQYGQPLAASSLFGSPRGYVGSNTYGAMTAALRDTPNAVVLLDEFEKAHPEVHKRFLTAWNDGFMTEASDGAKISTAGAIFIITTNAAAKQIGELAQRYANDRDELTRTSKEALREQGGFAPEVLSRIDRVFSFAALEGLDVARVVALEIERLVKSYGLAVADGGIDATILLEAIDRNKALAAGGVRELARAIEADVADGLIDAKAAGATMVRLSKDGARVLVESVTPPAGNAAGGAAPAAAGQTA
jgi:ATP-dependent Clp protease ATP-binding subunit ClpA